MYRSILLFLFALPYSFFSQEFIYKEFGYNEGLPSLQVYNIYQDKNGIVWFATDRGIANYNGYEIKQFGVKEGLPSNVVLGFFPQADGKVFCTTLDNSIFYFEEYFKGFSPYKYNDILSQHLRHNHTIKHLYVDENENLHISCIYRNGKLVINKKGEVLEPKNGDAPPLEKTKHVVYETHNNTLFYYLSNNISNVKGNARSISSDHNKIEMIVLPDSGYVVLKDESKVLLFDKEGEIISTIENEFTPIIVKAVSDSSFFIGYLFGGGRIVDVKGNTLETFLKDRSVTNFLIDREGGYWFTTLYSGVFYIKEPRVRIFSQASIDVPIHSLTKNAQGELFAGYDNGRVLKIDPENKASIYFDTNNKSRTLLEYDPDLGNSLFYSEEGFVINGKLIAPIPVPVYIIKFSEPAKKGMLVSQIGNIRLIDLYGNTPEKVIGLPFRSLDACYWKDDIYIASPGGVYVYTPGNELIDLKQKNKLFSYRVDDIDYNEKRNELYFASLGHGLIIYNKNTEKVSAITREEGLLSDIVNEVYIENENEVWVCTNSGLNKVTFNSDGEYSLTGFKSSNGLLNDGISDVEVINDVVWIASKKGLVYFPKELFEPLKDTTDYLLRMKKVFVNEKGASIESLRKLSYDKNRIEFCFEGVSLKRAGELIYKYKLEGLDKKWYYTKNRRITFSSLPHGKYVFKITVGDSNTQRGKYLTVPVIINPPFWKTYWFVILFSISIIGTVYFFFKIRILSYNRAIIRELLRILVKKIKRKDNYFVFKESGKNIRIKTDTILYVKSSGNYIELITENKTYVVRCKIGDFIAATPDPLEYLRIHRSFIIRIDKVEAKSKTEVIIRGEKIPVSHSYEAELEKLIF